MKVTTQTASIYPTYQETAASSFHLSDTLDWASLSAQIKNRVLIVPAYSPSSETNDQTIEPPAE